ncbi:hypothetical protein H5410_026357 [Solanum commersonii]|uniref:Uncharacterized protein n=1 Tax=Solanum commersonii TaxID=4109 RepID=A0A9J5YWB4_SOLCO|nr:hypothetical protein H5410_026357 [Solanum commersonii]
MDWKDTLPLLRLSTALSALAILWHHPVNTKNVVYNVHYPSGTVSLKQETVVSSSHKKNREFSSLHLSQNTVAPFHGEEDTAASNPKLRVHPVVINSNWLQKCHKVSGSTTSSLQVRTHKSLDLTLFKLPRQKGQDSDLKQELPLSQRRGKIAQSFDTKGTSNATNCKHGHAGENRHWHTINPNIHQGLQHQNMTKKHRESNTNNHEVFILFTKLYK